MYRTKKRGTPDSSVPIGFTWRKNATPGWTHQPISQDVRTSVAQQKTMAVVNASPSTRLHQRVRQHRRNRCHHHDRDQMSPVYLGRYCATVVPISRDSSSCGVKRIHSRTHTRGEVEACDLAFVKNQGIYCYAAGASVKRTSQVDSSPRSGQ